MTVARILIVEDNAANLALMDYLLRAFGYTPSQARDGAEGVAVAVREQPDLILMDVHLPRVTGLEALKQIRAADPRAFPIVAITALAMVGDREQVLAAGFDGYLSKPISPGTFVQDVETFLPEHLRAPRPSAPS